MTDPYSPWPVLDWTVTHRVIPEYVVPGRRLGRHVRHDSRSLAYRYQREPSRPLVSVTHTRHIPILDQLQAGDCTTNAGVGSAGTDPLFGALLPGAPVLDEALAISMYSTEEQLLFGTGYPPEDQGGDGLTTCKIMQQLGLISGYQHCLSVADFLAALQDGPVMLGCNWYDSFDAVDSSGLVTISPNAVVRGGHEIVARSLDVAGQLIGLDNSWGLGWGVAGSFSMSWATLERLLGEQGDGTVPVPLSQPAPVPVPIPVPPVPVPPAPVPGDADAALAAVARPWVTRRHEGANHRMAVALQDWLAAKGL